MRLTSCSGLRNASTGRGEVIKRTLFNPNFVSSERVRRSLWLNPVSNSAGKFKFLAFVEANKQRPKIFPARGGPRAKFVDHKTASKGLRTIHHADSEQDATSVASSRN